MDENGKLLSSSERVELITLLQNFSNLRTAQDQVLWSIFGSLWGTNALLLISFFSAGDKWSISQVGIVVSIIGLLISFIWDIIQTKTIARRDMYEDSIQYIEKKLCIDKELFAFSKVPKSSRVFKFRAKHLLKCYCISILFGWGLALIFFIWTY